jgi:hypothetical protein
MFWKFFSPGSVCDVSGIVIQSIRKTMMDFKDASEWSVMSGIDSVAMKGNVYCS